MEVNRSGRSLAPFNTSSRTASRPATAGFSGRSSSGVMRGSTVRFSASGSENTTAARDAVDLGVVGTSMNLQTRSANETARLPGNVAGGFASATQQRARMQYAARLRSEVQQGASNNNAGRLTSAAQLRETVQQSRVDDNETGNVTQPTQQEPLQQGATLPSSDLPEHEGGSSSGSSAQNLPEQPGSRTASGSEDSSAAGFAQIQPEGGGEERSGNTGSQGSTSNSEGEGLVRSGYGSDSSADTNPDGPRSEHPEVSSSDSSDSQEFPKNNSIDRRSSGSSTESVEMPFAEIALPPGVPGVGLINRNAAQLKEILGGYDVLLAGLHKATVEGVNGGEETLKIFYENLGKQFDSTTESLSDIEKSNINDIERISKNFHQAVNASIQEQQTRFRDLLYQKVFPALENNGEQSLTQSPELRLKYIKLVSDVMPFSHAATTDAGKAIIQEMERIEAPLIEAPIPDLVQNFIGKMREFNELHHTSFCPVLSDLNA